MTASHSAGEKPLNSAAKFALVLSALAVIAVFYGFVFVAVLLLAMILLLEGVLFLAAVRFGLGFFVAKVMERHGRVLIAFVRSLWLGKGDEFFIPLRPEEAPRLFSCLDGLAGRLGIARPDEVRVEMNMGAWVRLKGYRAGAGKTVLGLGYDLLALLSEREVEAVLAHEMAHAKLVQRGVSAWLNGGLGRAAGLTRRLAEVTMAYRQAKSPSPIGELFRYGADALTRLAARLLARYSRQDEFEADRGAVELCGAAPLRSALRRAEAVEEKMARLPWRERVAQLESSKSFSQWLIDELATSDLATPAETVRDPYSTHPTLHDRLAALPSGGPALVSGTPGLRLIEQPDRVAAELVKEILRVVAQQEQADTKSIGRWTRKAQQTRSIRAAQLPGGVIFLIGAILAIGTLVEFSWWLVFTGVGNIGFGAWLYRRGRYRDRRMLPVPKFAALVRARAIEQLDLEREEAGIETELRSRVPQGKKRLGAKAATDACYAALADCNFLRAHVAARLALEADRRSIEAALGMAVAAAGLGGYDQMEKMLAFVRQRCGIQSPAAIWGAGWALSLAGDWARAEALLGQAHDRHRDNPTFLALLACAQRPRNKLQSAAANAAKARALDPQDEEIAKLLIDILLSAGRLGEAEAQLLRLQDRARSDVDLALQMVRLRAARRDVASAQEWSAHLRALDQREHLLLRLGETFEEARHERQAQEYYETAGAAQFYPEAHLGLARLALSRRDKVVARESLLAALNLERTVGPRGRTPVQLFLPIVGQLAMLEEPREGCATWIVTLPAGFALPALAGISLALYASDQAHAEAHIDTLLRAMAPARSDLPSARTLAWKLGPRDQQPIRPVRPGVQFIA